MGLTAAFNLAVPALPDNQVWWANAAAWSNYWKDINVSVTFDPAVTNIYIQTAYDVNLAFVQFNISGVDQTVPSYAQHQSLVAAFVSLQTDYVALKTAMKAAGFISQA